MEFKENGTGENIDLFAEGIQFAVIGVDQGFLPRRVEVDVCVLAVFVILIHLWEQIREDIHRTAPACVFRTSRHNGEGLRT